MVKILRTLPCQWRHTDGGDAGDAGDGGDAGDAGYGGDGADGSAAGDSSADASTTVVAAVCVSGARRTKVTDGSDWRCWSIRQ